MQQQNREKTFLIRWILVLFLITGAQEPDAGWSWPNKCEFMYQKDESCLKLVGKSSISSVHFERRCYKKQKFKIFVECDNQSILGEHSNYFKNSKTRLRSDTFDKSLILYFASKYLKRLFEKSQLESDPSNIVATSSIYWTPFKLSNILLINI